MKTGLINIEQVRIALDRVGGSIFEKFVHALYPSIAGEEFIPLGGSGDGGADAFLGNGLFQGKSTGTFYQASTQEDYRSKVRHTVKRLREFGRDPVALIYVTSRSVKHIDVEEAQLSAELKVTIRIRDASYIAAHVNDSVGTRAAFETYLTPCLDFLKTVGSARLLAPSQHVQSPAIYVFLRQELDRREGKKSLVNDLADGLILWALEGTDPEKSIFLTEKQVIDKIEKAVPAAKKILRGVIPHRLRTLAKMPESLGRPVRWYMKQGYFCLSYEFRKWVEENNAEDESLLIAVLDNFGTRLAEFGDGLDPIQRRLGVEISWEVIQRTFECEGLEFAAFLEGKSTEQTFGTLADHIEVCLKSRGVKYEEFGILREAILANLMKAFYESTTEERLLYSRISKTYTLLFCLNTEPKLIEYFQDMASDFCLIVGSDILVDVLSERYLRPEDQKTRNTLKVIREAGGRVILTEPVLNEIYTHLAATDHEFANTYREIESSIGKVIADNVDRPLIRAYLYAKLIPPTGVVGPNNWPSFINQFCDYGSLHKPLGRELLRNYLISQFDMEYETEEDIAGVCKADEVDEIAERFLAEKDDYRLAKNDALMVFAVYGKRRQNREHSMISEFGYRTWWLTGESRILKYTKDIVAKYGGRYMMRPEFVLNFLTLLPSAAEVRRTYREVFPSLLGIQLARRVEPKVLTETLEKVREAQDLEPGRRVAAIAALSDKLKGDFAKEYGEHLDAVSCRLDDIQG